jgi:hypothetical protein
MSLISSLWTLLAGQAVVVFVAGLWLKVRLEASVKRQGDRLLEEQKYELRVREQAALVADLLAEWLANPEDKKRLNQLTFQAALWLPAEAAKELTRTLIWAPGAKNVHEILLLVRGILQKTHGDLSAADLVVFADRSPSQAAVTDGKPQGESQLDAVDGGARKRLQSTE